MNIAVLSGGGFKGVRHVGVLHALAAHGWRPDLLIGTSAGALVAACWIAGDRMYGPSGGLRLNEELWFAIRKEQAYKEYPWWHVALRVLRKKLGIYGHRVLLDTIREKLGEHLGDGAGAEVCYVRLDSGEAIFAPATDVAVWASTTIPIIWEPVSAAELEGGALCVDGGLREYCPLGRAMDVVAASPDSDAESEIVAVLCSPLTPEWAYRLGDIKDVALRSQEIQGSEIARGDIKTHLLLNHLAEEAAGWGKAHTKLDGSPLRRVRLIVVPPSEPQGGTLERTDELMRWRYELGIKDGTTALAGD
jgi:NTE family protein